MPFGFTLIGAYHVDGRPLERRRLVVALELRRFDVARATLAGFVHAEEIASRARATGIVAFGRRRLAAYRIRFSDAHGRRCALDFGHDASRPPIVALTELRGTIGCEPGGQIGSLTLRFDWRSLLAPTRSFENEVDYLSSIRQRF
jgi:hypothetical protein